MAKKVISYCIMCGCELTEEMADNIEIWSIYFPNTEETIYDVCEECFGKYVDTIIETQGTIYEKYNFSDFVYVGTKVIE